jgi:hypothetical protein
MNPDLKVEIVVAAPAAPICTAVDVLVRLYEEQRAAKRALIADINALTAQFRATGEGRRQ